MLGVYEGYNDFSLKWKKSILGTYSFAPAVADINNDGKKEIIVVQAKSLPSGPSSPSLRIFDYSGNELINPKQLYLDVAITRVSPPSISLARGGIAVADINGDGDKEIIISG